MDITVTLLDGNSHKLSLDPQGIVSSLKRLIKDELGFPVQQQKLLFNNGQNTLLSDDSKPVRDYGLQPGSQVSLLVTEPPTQPATQSATIQVLLINETRKSQPYDIKPDETVSSFMRRVQYVEGVPESQQRLIYNGKQLMEGRLTDYGVTAGSTIYLTLRLRGGGANSHLVNM